MEGWVSDRYRRKERSTRVRVRVVAAPPIRIETSILPAARAVPRP